MLIMCRFIEQMAKRLFYNIDKCILLDLLTTNNHYTCVECEDVEEASILKNKCANRSVRRRSTHRFNFLWCILAVKTYVYS